VPASIAARGAGSSRIVVRSERHGETFRAGLKSFLDEARRLARFDPPATLIGEAKKSSGVGFRQNIVGSGTDNAVDAPDRRVAFRIVPCPG